MDPQSFVEKLKTEVMLLDGAMGTQLIAQGLQQGRAPEWWTLEHPEKISSVHRLYVEAGSNIIITNSFGATPPKLMSAGLEGRCKEINQAAVACARGAAGSNVLVAGDLGPTGLMFPPMGEATEEQLIEAFSEQVRVLAQSGVDLLIIETMFDLREALCAVKAAREAQIPIMISMTFDQKKRGFFSMVGDRVAPTLQALEDAGAHAVGFNCSISSKAMINLIQEARAATQAPLLAQPNAGQPKDTQEGIVYDAQPGDFAQDLMQIVTAGANLIGGCCGTTPEFIRAARKLLEP